MFTCQLLDCCKRNPKCGRKLKHKLIGVMADVYGLLSSADEPWSAYILLLLEEVLYVGDRDRSSTSRSSFHINGFIVLKKTMVLRRWVSVTKSWFYQKS